jgi:hypothetical protein
MRALEVAVVQAFLCGFHELQSGSQPELPYTSYKLRVNDFY